MSNEEIQVPGTVVPAGPEVPGVSMEQGEVAAPVVETEVAVEAPVEPIEAPQVADPEHSAPAEATVIDPMQPVGPN